MTTSCPTRVAGVVSRLTLLLVVLAGQSTAQAQSIAFVLPEAAQHNQSIDIFGSGFVAGTVVRFGGIVAGSTTLQNNKISATVPNSAPLGPVTLSVQNPPGPQVFSLTNFTVLTAAPYVSSFTPTHGPGGSVIALNGFQFIGNLIAVGVNGTNVAGFWIESESRVFVTNHLQVTTGPITVVGNGTGFYTTSNKFYVTPVISGFSPANGQAGSQLTITGVNFTDATQVLIGGVNVPLFTVNNNAQITATLPFGVVSGPVTVWTPGPQQTVTSSNFTVLPSITSMSPGNGTAGTVVTLSGANLNVSPVSVKFNGVNGTIQSSNFNQIIVTAPVSSSGPVTVTTGDGTATAPSLFYYPPSITSFTPGAGGGGTLVNINGQSLTNASLVLFDGAPALFYTVSNNTLIQAAAPNNVSSGPISVTTPGGVAFSSNLFYGPVTFTGFLPSSGAPGTDVILFGANFDGASSVTFNGVAAEILSNTGTQIGTKVPTGARSGFVTVTTPAGSYPSPSQFIVPNIADVRTNTFNHTPNPVTVTSNLTLVLVPSNDGPDTASNVVVSVLLSSSVVLNSAAAEPPGILNTNGNPVTMTIPSMTQFQNPALTLVVAPQQVGNITNVCTLTSGTIDPNANNNSITRVTLVQPVPVLEISAQDASTMRVSWPFALSNYTLQSVAALTTNGTWTNIITPPFIEGDERVVLQPSTGQARYYRLKK